MTKLFLSRDELGPDLTAVRERGLAEVEFKSCIRLRVVAAGPPPRADWLFFLSPSGVELFAERFSAKGFKTGVIWDGTAKAMGEYLGREPDFTARSTDSAEAVAEFLATLKADETVTVVQSAISRRRFDGLLPPARLHEWTLYTNEPDPPEAASDADYLLFTSPSNAEAYLGRHGLTAHQKPVAIGRTTLARLHELGYGDALLSGEPSERGMWEVVRGVAEGD